MKTMTENNIRNELAFKIFLFRPGLFTWNEVLNIDRYCTALYLVCKWFSQYKRTHKDR